MANFELCKFTPEEIDEAIEGLNGLQQLIVPWFKAQNFEGIGESDAAECEKHLMMGKHALTLMAEGLEIMKKEAAAVADESTTA